MIEYKVHPAAELFPMIEGDDMESLVNDIKTNGLREAIKVQGEWILDGRNRLEACTKANITPRFEKVEGDPIAYICSANIHRRHLSTTQRAAIAADLANMTKQDTLKQNTDGPNGPSEKISTEQAAKMMNVSPRSVKRARKVKREDPVAHEAAKAGKRPASTKPRTSTKPRPKAAATIATEEGLMSANSGGSRQTAKAAVEGIDPGAWGSKDEERIRAAARRAKARQDGEQATEEPKQEATAARTELTQKEESKLDIAIRKAKRVLEIEQEILIERRVTEWLDEVLPRYNMEFEFYKKSNDSYKGVMTYKQYKDLEGFLHPDRHPENEARAARLFALVRDNKFLLCGERPEELQNGAGSLPKTAAELMAQRRKRH